MAFSIQNNKRNKHKKVLMSEINVTPFVDVLLVLLIIFMVAAPMLTGSVNVDLPSGVSNPIEEKSEPIILTINEEGLLFLQDENIKFLAIGEKLLQISNNNLTQKIYVKADKKIDYGRVMDVIKTVNQTGFSKVILVTELAQ